MRKMIVLCIVAAILLSGCGSAENLFVTKYSEMEYVRPDMENIQTVLRESCDAALYGESLDDVVNGVWEYYWVYDDFYTNYNLAYIHYCGDLTDIYWEDEYTYCADNSASVDAGLDELYYALADSPYREELESEEYFGAGYFDAYEGESIWDAAFLGLLEQETALINEYYSISAEAMETVYYSDEYFNTYGMQLGELFVELVAVRQELASYVGYDSYPEFAYDFYYYRDYTPWEAMEYTRQVRQELADLYRQMNTSDIWEASYADCTEQETYEYVRSSAKQMGGLIEECFRLMDEKELYDIAYGENKSGISFEVYLTNYYAPYVFTSPTLTAYDKLTFAHEFGHFVNDHACGGSYSGIDVAEVFSQSMEYLSLCYSEGVEDLEKFKVVDSLCTFVEEAAYAAFEHQVYSLQGEDLTLENVHALYEEICLSYGFDSWNWDSRDFVVIEHFFTEPMYIISYVVSNDVAFQIYQLEKETPGAGLELYQSNAHSSETYIVSFAESVGLESPFADNRLRSIRQSMEEILN